jgi:hypothetical protein
MPQTGPPGHHTGSAALGGEPTFTKSSGEALSARVASSQRHSLYHRFIPNGSDSDRTFSRSRFLIRLPHQMGGAHMDTGHPDWERQSIPILPPVDLDFTDRPGIAALYAISGVLLDLLGPMFWAALIVLFIRRSSCPERSSP